MLPTITDKKYLEDIIMFFASDGLRLPDMGST